MKRLYFFFLIGFLLIETVSIDAQEKLKVDDKLKTMNNDTVRYMKEQILAQKDKYTDKPLDSLLKDLPHPVTDYINILSNKMFIYPATYISIYAFSERTDRIASKKDPLSLIITWKIPLTKEELANSGLHSLGGQWTTVAKDFFNCRIIENISMVKYNF
jgi:hypothetical protein